MSRYTAFTDNQVFENHAINIVGNKLFDAIIVQYPAKDLSVLYAISGKTSRIAQNQATGSAQNLALVTSDTEIFSYLQSNVKSLFEPDTCIKLKNTLQFTKYNFFFEVHFLQTAISTVVQDSLYLHEIGKIPAYIL